MEKERDRDTTSEPNCFVTLLEQAEQGDKQAIEALLHLFESDINYLAKFIKLPREDALQALKTEFIEMIRKGMV